MLDTTDPQDDRQSQRRARRWRRRARIAGPFLVVPAMLGGLLLLVDLIEYRPAAKSRPSTVPTLAATGAKPSPSRDAMIHEPDAALSVSVFEASVPTARGTFEPAPVSPGLPAGVAESASAATP
jgi:hypothetical protein